MVPRIGVLADTEGMDTFLQALDVGKLKRYVATKLVQSLNGKSKVVICQAGNDITFTTIGPNNPEGKTKAFVIGKQDNVNENEFLGQTIVDLHWEVSTDGRCALVADMKREDGRTAQQRRSLVETGATEMLLMETIVDGVCMSQRFVCEERPALMAAAATTCGEANQSHVEVSAEATLGFDEADSGGTRAVQDDCQNVLLENQPTEQSSFDTWTPMADAAPTSDETESAVDRVANSGEENVHNEKQQAEHPSLATCASPVVVEDKDEQELRNSSGLPPPARSCMCWMRCIQRVHVLPGDTSSMVMYESLDQSID